MTTRAEHLAWAKERALACVEAGETTNAVASMASDLRKHEHLADHPGIELGVGLLAVGGLRTPREVRDWIEGFR